MLVKVIFVSLVNILQSCTPISTLSTDTSNLQGKGKKTDPSHFWTGSTARNPEGTKNLARADYLNEV